MIQRDNQLNLAITELNTEIATSSAKIAEESRRDSASMKTIAVLTLVFLPGAFVAVSQTLNPNLMVIADSSRVSSVCPCSTSIRTLANQSLLDISGFTSRSQFH